MEIIGLDDMLKNKKETLLDYAKKKMDELHIDLNTFTKAAILSLKDAGKIKEYEEQKKIYLEEVIKVATKDKLIKFTKNNIEEIKRVKRLEEFELEIQQAKVEAINEKLEELK